MADRSVSSRWRALSLLLVGLVAGTLLLTPAGAHIGTPNHLWKKHLKAKVVAQINKHLNKPTLITIPCGDWAAHSGSSSITHATIGCLFGSTGAAADQRFELEAPIPAALQGNRVKVTGFEICYDANPNAVLDRVLGTLMTNATEVGSGGSSVMSDGTDRDDEACRLHPMNTTLTPDDVLQFTIWVDYSTTSSIWIGRTTIRIQRTGSAAPPLS